MEKFDRSFLNGANANYLDQLYQQYSLNPDNVDPQWQEAFSALPSEESTQTNSESLGSSEWVESAFKKQSQVTQLIDNYRSQGHLSADIDPLRLMNLPQPKELELEHNGLSDKDMESVFDAGTLGAGGRKTLREILQYLKQVYSSSVGYEYYYISDSEQREWLRERIETAPSNETLSAKERLRALEKITAAEVLETHLHRKYVGQKRFSLEGSDALIPLVDTLVQESGHLTIEEIVVGMAHRGRLNVLINILGKSPAELFKEFEGEYQIDENDPDSAGDVKYHMGFSSDIQTDNRNIHIALAFNPSHLEIVNPVVEGSVRARQERRNNKARDEVLPILIHGDAAFAGQGVVMETLNMSRTRGYSTGGTLHIIVNNQIGFTTNALDARSTIYCTEVGKMVQAPIFHVNGDDPDAVTRIGKLALAYRDKFKTDVIIDLISYRRHGHNEADEPKLTQPVMYDTIRQKPTPRALYAEKLEQEGLIQAGYADNLSNEYRANLDAGIIMAGQIIDPAKMNLMTDWSVYQGTQWDEPINTGVPAERLSALSQELYDVIPDSYGVHRRIEQVYQDRIKMSSGEMPIDWGCAEILAYGTLVQDGSDVRLSGQDCGRGTFSHRHAVVHNQNEATSIVPLRELSGAQQKFLVINSLLSEEAVLGFEYGYSTTNPDTLVIWEAQFGDFANGAQVVIDQFISAGFAKWNRISGLVLFLPHGQEGQGSEHSSARLERFLQLCAGTNMQVCVPTTPAQTFHMLRRQMMRSFRRPLVVMTPKSLLRHKLAVSDISDFTEGRFESIIADDKVTPDKAKRIVLCSGKVYYDILEERESQQTSDVAIVRIEQLHPFPIKQLQALLSDYSATDDIVWVQEEPRNQGAWRQIRHRLEESLQNKQHLSCCSRNIMSAPAVGYYKLFVEQQRRLVMDALDLSKTHKTYNTET